MSMSIELPPEVEERLASLAQRTGLSKEDFLLDIIERVMEDIEDCYLGMEVLDRVKSGEERVYSAAEVRKRLGRLSTKI